MSKIFVAFLISISLFTLIPGTSSQFVQLQQASTIIGYPNIKGSRWYVLNFPELTNVTFTMSQTHSEDINFQFYLANGSFLAGSYSFTKPEPVYTLDIPENIIVMAIRNPRYTGGILQGTTITVEADGSTLYTLKPIVGTNSSSYQFLDTKFGVPNNACPSMMTQLNGTNYMTQFTLYRVQNGQYVGVDFNADNSFSVDNLPVASSGQYIVGFIPAQQGTLYFTELIYFNLQVDEACNNCTDYFWDIQTANCTNQLQQDDYPDQVVTEEEETPTTTVTDPVCGNGVVEDGEDCDDGNTENEDDCPDTCVLNANLGLILPLAIGLPIVAGVIITIIATRGGSSTGRGNHYTESQQRMNAESA